MTPPQEPHVVGENEVFWGEMAPAEHIIHLYADDGAFLDMLEGFVSGGLRAGEGVIVIATDVHMFALNERLDAKGIDLRAARASDQYLALNAEACLALFMVNGAPDAMRFNEVITELIARAGRNGRRVRAFGEMVAILWDKGHCGATVQLEHLWNQLRETMPFPLFCSYPKSGFTKATRDSLKEICATHTKVILNRGQDGWGGATILD